MKKEQACVGLKAKEKQTKPEKEKKNCKQITKAYLPQPESAISRYKNIPCVLEQESIISLITVPRLQE